MGKLTTWKFERFDIRMIEIRDEPWFIGTDIASALGYTNPRKAVLDHVSSDDKGVTKRDTPGGAQGMIIINESGLYSLILSSKMSSAKKFKQWVTSEVLPSIRKTGSYTLTGSVTQDNIQSVLSALNALEVKFNQYQNMLSQVCGKLGIHECLKADSIVDDTMPLISDDCTCSSRSVDVLEFSRNLKKFGFFLVELLYLHGLDIITMCLVNLIPGINQLTSI